MQSPDVVSDTLANCAMRSQRALFSVGALAMALVATLLPEGLSELKTLVTGVCVALVIFAIFRTCLSDELLFITWSAFWLGSYVVFTAVFVVLPVSEFRLLMETVSTPAQQACMFAMACCMGVIHAAMPANLRWKLAVGIAAILLSLAQGGIVLHRAGGWLDGIVLFFLQGPVSLAACAFAKLAAHAIRAMLETVRARAEAVARASYESLEVGRRAHAAAQCDSALRKLSSRMAEVSVTPCAHSPDVCTSHTGVPSARQAATEPTASAARSSSAPSPSTSAATIWAWISFIWTGKPSRSWPFLPWST